MTLWARWVCLCRDVPVGVLYDLFVQDREDTPWRLVLHVTDYPSSILAPYFGENTVKSHMFNSLKEAAFVASGTASKVNFMVAGAKDDMWKAVIEPSLDVYKEILGSIGLISGNCTDTSTPKNPDTINESEVNDDTEQGVSIPVRIYARKGKEYLSSYADILRVSTRIPAFDSLGAPMTLREALVDRIGSWLGLFDGDSGSVGSKFTGNQRNERIDVVFCRIGSVIIQGLSFTKEKVLAGGKETELQMLHREMHGPDFFLYIVVHIT